MAAARFGNESGVDSSSDNESSCSEENVNDYECYDGVLGYQYEPKKRVRSPVPVPVEPDAEGASPNSVASGSDSRTDSVVVLPPDPHSLPDRVGNTDWCTCSRCAAMPTNVESLCCHDSLRISDKMSEYTEAELSCMVDHPGFMAVCLNPWVLDVAYLQFKHQYQETMDYPQHEIYRHTAYRQLVRWCWGIVGRNHRVPLPSCVVNKIRETFPNPEGKQYTGFKWSTL